MKQQENNDCPKSVEVKTISICKTIGAFIGLFIALQLNGIPSEMPQFAVRYLPCIVIGYMAGNAVCAIEFLCKAIISELKK